MNTRSKVLLAALLFVAPFLTFIMYKVAAGNQQPTLITLKSSEGVVGASGPISSIFSSSDGKSVYMVNGVTGGVEAFSSETNESIHSLAETSGPIAIGVNRYTAQVDKDLNVSILDPAGNLSVRFPTYPVTSLAVLSNGSVVVASPTMDHFLHIYSPTGNLVKSFGTIKDYDRTNSTQNQFLHKGKVLVDSSGDIYYVFHYVPLIQKFSPIGELKYEVEIKGDAIDLQQELAQRFFSIKDVAQVGGIGIISSAAIDPETGHLWICMYGSSLTGTVYEYSSQGEKLREYSLEVNSSMVPPQTIVGVNDIAITRSKLYALTPQNQVYSFDRNGGKPTRIGRLNQTMQQVFLFSMPGMPFLSALNLAPSARTQIQGCGASQPWEDCVFNCPGVTCNGTQPTNTSSNSSKPNCQDALASTLNAGHAVVSSVCTKFPVGTPMHMRGGCRSDVTICTAPGNNSGHFITLDCPEPPAASCSGGGSDGGEGGGGSPSWCGIDTPPSCSDGIDNDGDGDTDLADFECVCPSPIVIDTLGNGFNLTSAGNGVLFDIAGAGHLLKLSWIQGDDAWLALDRNGNGAIDNGKELFGNYTPQPPTARPHGFLALAEFDKPSNGGNGDGQIDSRDSIFPLLRLWRDTNHNGTSEQSELHSLVNLGVAILDLNYKESKRTDQYGNRFRYRAKVKDVHGAQVGRWAWDVFLVSQ